MTGIDPGYTMCFMGHSSDMSALYLEKSPVELEDQYMRVEPLLTIYKTTTDETVRVLNTQIEETQHEIDSLNRSLRLKDDQIYNLQKRMEQFEDVAREAKSVFDFLVSQGIIPELDPEKIREPMSEVEATEYIKRMKVK